MTTSEPDTAIRWMDTAAKERLRTAADRAKEAYPGPVGDLLRQELLSWMVFGRLLGSSLIMRLADELLIDVPSGPGGPACPGGRAATAEPLPDVVGVPVR